mmetsp:Transcript_42947/g.109892  ORF Transcript_42947/g.109892 Transcript_42947/m.109892 type:complete len:368 (-) Transcript_42947:68-1171(-)
MGTLSLSKATRPLRKASTLPIDFLPAFHDRSLGILPPGAVSTMHALTTCTTSAAGLPNDLSSPRLPLSSELSAASASAMMGSAASRSLAHSSWNAVTSSASLEHASSSSRPASTASSTTAFSCPMFTMSASVWLFFSSTMICSCLRLTCRSATCALACAILSTPFSRRSRLALSSSRFWPSSPLYSEMSSRKLLGVEYTWRRSMSRKRTAACVVVVCTNAMWYAMFSRTSSSMSGMSSRKRWLTLTSASCGHEWNQSNTVLLTSAGNWRARMRNLSPTGLKHRMTCRYLRTLSMKKSHRFSGVSRMPAPLHSLRTEFIKVSLSSWLKRSVMRPVASRSLRNTRKCSFTIWLSVMRKLTGVLLTPALT